MKTVPQTLDLLDRKTDRLLARLAEVEPAILHAPPVLGAWSPLQVMHHIALVERNSVNYLLYKFGQEEKSLRPQTLKSRLSGKLVIAALISPLKFRAPVDTDVSGQNLLDAPTLDDLRTMLDSSRTDLRGLLTRADASWLKGAIYRHPTAGYLSLKDMVMLFLVHHDRHARQIDRALAQNAREFRR